MDWRDLLLQHVPGFDYEHSPRFRALCRRQQARVQARLKTMQRAEEQETMRLPALDKKVFDLFETQPHAITRHTEGIRPIRLTHKERVE